MSKILCLETATTNCSVALSVDGSAIALREDRSPGFSHSEKLHVFIEEVLSEAGVTYDDLDAIAVSKGPGSYTGLRIGVSAAKGLCYSLGVPLIAISTLKSLAVQFLPKEGVVIPLLDARRMEVYSAVFDSEGNQIRETLAEILSERSFEDVLQKGKVTFVGSGAAKLSTVLDHANANYISDALPSAATMAALANVKYKISDTEDVAYFEPFYLKDFVTGKG